MNLGGWEFRKLGRWKIKLLYQKIFSVSIFIFQCLFFNKYTGFINNFQTFFLRQISMFLSLPALFLPTTKE